MQNNHYLSIGTKLGGHYEIERVLGEDDFEILYLAKDLNKQNKYVVLKELFFKKYSYREENEVKTLAKSKIIFEETKKEVIKEVEALISKPSIDEIATYGSFEENNTVYTIMEFINNSNLDSYMKTNNIEKAKETITIEPLNKNYTKEDTFEPTPKKRVHTKQKEKPKSSIFMKILITSLLICIGLGYYAYNMIKEDKQKIKKRPPEAMVVKEIPEEESTKEETNKKELPLTQESNLNDSNKIKDKNDNKKNIKQENDDGKAFITDIEAYKKEQEAKKRAKEEEAKKKALEEEKENALEDEEEQLREDEYKKMQEEKNAKDKELNEKSLEDEVNENALEDEEEQLREDEYKKMHEEAQNDKKNTKNIENEQNTKEFIPDNIREFIGEEEDTSNHPENDVPASDGEEILPLGAKPNISLGKPISTEKRDNNPLGKKIK